MKTILILAALSAFGVAQIGVKDFCDDQRFLACTSGLGQFWSVAPTQIWENPYRFAETINQLFVPPYNINNLVKVCNGLSLFYQCLSAKFIRICLGPIGWVGRGRSPNEAFAFDGMLSSLVFQCGPGFDSLTRAPNTTECLQRVTLNYDNEISQFYRAYELNITHDVNNACLYGQTLVNGITAIYGSGPCRANKGHAQWFACEMTRDYVFSQFRHCQHQITCPKSSTVQDFSHMIREGASGDVEFLLPAHWQLGDDGETWEMTMDRWI